MTSLKRFFSLFVIFSFSVFLLHCKSKKHTDAEYLNFASKVMQDTMPKMMQKVQEQVKAKGYAEAVSFCSTFAPEFGKNKNVEWTEKAREELGAKTFRLARISMKNRNPKNAANAKQAAIFSQWLKEGGQPTVYRDNEKIVTMHPIQIAMPLCLGCHGDSATLDKKAGQVIQKLYPEDKAVGYKMGELRGAFVTEINTTSF